MNAPFSRSLISDHNFWSCHKDDFLNQFWKLWGQIFPFGYLPFSAATSSSWVTLLNRLKGWNALNNQNTQLNIVTIQGFRMPKILPVSKKKQDYQWWSDGDKSYNLVRSPDPLADESDFSKVRWGPCLVTIRLKTSENSWEHWKTSKIIWNHPENNWQPIIDNWVEFEEDFNSRTKKSENS